jgi:hypothetical protein
VSESFSQFPFNLFVIAPHCTSLHLFAPLCTSLHLFAPLQGPEAASNDGRVHPEPETISIPISSPDELSSTVERYNPGVDRAKSDSVTREVLATPAATNIHNGPQSVASAAVRISSINDVPDMKSAAERWFKGARVLVVDDGKESI